MDTEVLKERQDTMNKAEELRKAEISNNSDKAVTKKVARTTIVLPQSKERSRDISINKSLTAKRVSQQVETSAIKDQQPNHKRGKSREYGVNLKPLNSDLKITTKFPSYTPQFNDQTPQKSLDLNSSTKETSHIKRSHTPSVVLVKDQIKLTQSFSTAAEVEPKI